MSIQCGLITGISIVVAIFFLVAFLGSVGYWAQKAYYIGKSRGRIELEMELNDAQKAD